MQKIKSLFSSKKRVFLFVVGILVVGSILFNAFAPKNIPEDQQYTVTRTKLASTTSFSGEVQADEKATLLFQTGGRLVFVGAKQGDYVQEGQVIAQLDQSLLKKQMEKYLNTYGKVRNNFDQSKDDNEDRISVESEDEANSIRRIFANLQLDLNNSVLDVELQALSLQYSTLTTPISGILTRVDAPYAGVNIPVSTGYEVVNPQTIYFAALIDQTELSSIFPGSTGTVVLDAFPDTEMTGLVERISFTPKAGETGTVYEAKIALTGTDTSLFRLGMTGDITFILEERDNVLVIPLRFIKTVADDDFVMKRNGNSFEEVKITTGEELDGLVEITEGLQEGDVIVEFTQ